jgi:hypothetical protein
MSNLVTLAVALSAILYCFPEEEEEEEGLPEMTSVSDESGQLTLTFSLPELKMASHDSPTSSLSVEKIIEHMPLYSITSS